MDFPWKVPYIPGDVSNATTYDYPVLFKTYRDVDLQCVTEGDPNQCAKVVAAAKDMASQGVKGIAGDCGFLANYLPEVAAEVDLPVFISSLQLLPMAARMIGPDKVIAIITAFPDKMLPELLAKVGFHGEREIVAIDAGESNEFNTRLMQPSDYLDSDKMESEMALRSQM